MGSNLREVVDPKLHFLALHFVEVCNYHLSFFFFFSFFLHTLDLREVGGLSVTDGSLLNVCDSDREN